MKKPLDIFCEVPCLTERSTLLSGIALQKKWFKAADKRIIAQYLHKFIDYNLPQLQFLGVEPFIVGTDQHASLAFRTTSYIGAVPLRSPDTGKQIGDFVVRPKYTGRDRFESYIDILKLLGTEISPEVQPSIPLASGRNFRPPLYLEAVKFIGLLEKLLTKPWRKFDAVEVNSPQPLGQVNWNKYITSDYKVEKRLKYPVRKNVLSEFHPEFAQIRYVFDLCKLELLSANTPLKIKGPLRSKLSFIEEKLYFHKPQPAQHIKITRSDSLTIRQCKEQANAILSFNFTKSTAWRVDFSNVFEKFVQYLFSQAAKEMGGKLFTNYKLNSKTHQYYDWELKHLEPDAIFQKDDSIVFIDAKYKSNLYNKFHITDLLKEDHRHDLHQILAYASFSNAVKKSGILCYPSEQLEIKSTSYNNPINNTQSRITILGLPLQKNTIHEAKGVISQALSASN